MISINHFPFHIGDYLRKTRGLDAAEHGAYLLLLLELYISEGAVEYDSKRLQRVCQVSSLAQWKKIEPVILSFCIVTDGIITHSKVLSVLKEIQNISEKNKENANRRWAKKPRKNNEGNMRAQSDRNANQKPKAIHIGNKGEEGSSRRRLFNLIAEVHGDAAWASWFDGDRVSIEDVNLFPKSVFIGKKIEQEFHTTLIAAGFILCSPKEEAA